MKWANLLFGYQGRIRRMHFWAGVGVLLLIRVLFVLLAAGLAFGVGQGGGASENVTDLAVGLTAIPLYALLLWSGFAITVKRCHDRGNSGWWSLLLLIPLAGAIWALIDLGCLDGTPGLNAYGPSPKGIDSLTVDAFA